MFRTVDSSGSLWILYNSSTAKNYLFVICDYTSRVYIKSFWMKITYITLCVAFCLICYALFVLNFDDHFGDCFYVLYLFTVFIVCIVYWLRHPPLFFLFFINIPAAWRAYVYVPSRGLTLLEHFFLYVYVCIIIGIRIRIVINTFWKVTHKVIHYNGTEQWPTYLICVDLYVYWKWSFLAPVCPSFVCLLIYFYISFINSTVQSPDKPMPWHCVRLCVCK